MNIFTIVYWLGMVLEVVIRTPFQLAVKAAAKSEQRVSRTEQVLLGLLTLGGLILPLIYSVTSWLGFANYHLPVGLGWLGVFLLACAVFLFGRAHTDLKSNWSPSLEIYQRHTLITSGIYGYIRHPMYTSQWVMVVAQILLIQNWLAGPAGLLVFIPFYFLRVRAEESMMLDTFGEQYRQYLQKTGSVIPKLSR